MAWMSKSDRFSCKGQRQSSPSTRARFVRPWHRAADHHVAWVAHGTHDSKRILKNRPLSWEIASRPKCGRSFLLCFVPSVSLPSVPADYRSALGLIRRASAMLRFSTPHHSIMAAVMQSAKDSAHQNDSSEQPATVCSPTRSANRNVMPLTGS
jgi:hypothetical protein